MNTEEELLEFEATQFPILQTMIAYKEPYDKLWRTALSFHNKHEAWLNGKQCSVKYETFLFSIKQLLRVLVKISSLIRHFKQAGSTSGLKRFRAYSISFGSSNVGKFLWS